MSIHGPILRSLLSGATKVRVVDDKGAYTGAQLLIASLHVAAALKPLAQSNAVGVLMPSSSGFPIAALGAWMMGKVVVPLNFLLKREELEYVIADSGLDTIVTVQPMLDFMGYTPGAPAGRTLNILRLEDVKFRSVPEPIWPAFAEDDELAVLLYTSGTSGKPKGVMLTHANIRANIEQCRGWIDIDKNFVFLGVLPQFHSFGMTALTLLPMTVGCKVIYTARFVPHRIIQLLREHRPDVFVAIPSMYNALLHAKDAQATDFSSVRFLVSGGEPLPSAVFDGFRSRFQVTINEGYGLTETSPVTNWCRPQDWRPRSVGMPMPMLEQRVVDPATNRPVPLGAEGEVQMRGPNVMRGYYHLPEQTASVFTPDGFFKTGDMGKQDADGHLYITGRIKEMLIIAGENVFPREIEEVLCRHDAVKDAGVVGMSDPMRGELPVAFVELKEGATFDEMALKAHCRTSLAGYKVPTHIRQLPALPRTPTGKVLRRELKKLIDQPE